MGRKSKSTRLKLLHGNPGGRPLANEPKPKPVAPKMPVSLDKGARRVWRGLAPKLESLGLLTEVDKDVFAVFCQISSRLSWIRSQLKDDGIDIKNRSFYMKEERLYGNLLKSYASEFGLSPTSRLRLGIQVDKELSDFEKLLDGSDL